MLAIDSHIVDVNFTAAHILLLAAAEQVCSLTAAAAAAAGMHTQRQLHDLLSYLW